MFIIKYRQNPIQYHNLNHTKLIYAQKQIIRSLHNINHKLISLRKHQSFHLNVDRNYRRVIRGLSQIYGFKPKSFVNDNLIMRHHHTYLKSSNQRLTIESWLYVIQQISAQLKQIWSADNLKQIHAIYHGFVFISGIHVDSDYKIADHARIHLAELGNAKRYQFIGHYARFGRKTNGQLSILLKHITYHGKEVTDHLWFSYTQGFRKLGHLKDDQKIKFEARVKKYHKGYVSRDFIKHYDYKLSYPSKITKV